MAKANIILDVEHVPVPENLTALSFENYQQFVDSEGNMMFAGTDSNGETNCTADYNLVQLDAATDIVLETQPGVRTEHSGLSTASIKELADSLHVQGQVQPISVRVFQDEEGNIQYHLIAGLRRCLAARMNAEAGRDSILAAMIRVVNDDEAKALALVENVSREDMSPLEVAAHIETALNATKWNNTKAASMLGIQRQTVSDYAQILKACEVDQNFAALWKSGKLSYTAALVLAQQEDRETRAKVYARAFEIEVQKAKAQKAQAEAKEAANAASGKAPTKKAAPTVTSSTLNKGVGAGKSATANVAKGAVSKASVEKAAGEITGNKPKCMSGRQVVEMFRGEVSDVLFDSRVVMAFAQICGVIEGTIPEDNAGIAFQLLKSCLRPELVKEQKVIAGTAKAATKTAAPKTAATSAPATNKAKK